MLFNHYYKIKGVDFLPFIYELNKDIIDTYEVRDNVVFVKFVNHAILPPFFIHLEYALVGGGVQCTDLPKKIPNAIQLHVDGACLYKEVEGNLHVDPKFEIDAPDAVKRMFDCIFKKVMERVQLFVEKI